MGGQKSNSKHYFFFIRSIAVTIALNLNYFTLGDIMVFSIFLKPIFQRTKLVLEQLMKAVILIIGWAMNTFIILQAIKIKWQCDSILNLATGLLLFLPFIEALQ